MKKTYEAYFDNDELFVFLKHYKEKYPRWFSYESIGKSALGQDIWLITLTDHTVSSPERKPAFWIEANIHSSEVTGTQGALYFCEKIIEGVEKNKNSSQKKENEEKTEGSSSSNEGTYSELLEKITYYILPRFTPDGAAAFFKEKNSTRSTPLERPYRFQESSFKRKDLDGDGEITLMRWRDPSGSFKESKSHPGVLVPRDPFDFSQNEVEVYYHVLPEGVFENFDGFSKAKNNDFGYDFNRQAPSYYSPEGQQKGAGEIPLEFPEPRAVADAFRKRKNIFSSISYHTYGGFIIKPPSSIKNHDLELGDFLVIEKMAEILNHSTGYSVHSGNDDFVYIPGKPLSGNFDEWYFLHLGVYGITVEYWDPWQEAKMQWKKAVEKYESLSDENMTRLLSWSETHLKKSDYFKDWKKFPHPQLGEVEIGGFKTAYYITNPPPKFLKKELEKVFQGTLKCSQMFPNLIIKSLKKQVFEESIIHVEVVIANTGYLPTYGSSQALAQKAMGVPVVTYKEESHKDASSSHLGSVKTASEVKASRVQNSEFKWIKKVTTGEVKHLRGYSDGAPRVSPFFGTNFSHLYEQKLEWIFQGNSGSQIELEIDYGKGGIVAVKF